MLYVVISDIHCTESFKKAPHRLCELAHGHITKPVGQGFLRYYVLCWNKGCRAWNEIMQCSPFSRFYISCATSYIPTRYPSTQLKKSFITHYLSLSHVSVSLISMEVDALWCCCCSSGCGGGCLRVEAPVAFLRAPPPPPNPSTLFVAPPSSAIPLPVLETLLSRERERGEKRWDEVRWGAARGKTKEERLLACGENHRFRHIKYNSAHLINLKNLNIAKLTEPSH